MCVRLCVCVCSYFCGCVYVCASVFVCVFFLAFLKLLLSLSLLICAFLSVSYFSLFLFLFLSLSYLSTSFSISLFSLFLSLSHPSKSVFCVRSFLGQLPFAQRGRGPERKATASQGTFPRPQTWVAAGGGRRRSADPHIVRPHPKTTQVMPHLSPLPPLPSPLSIFLPSLLEGSLPPSLLFSLLFSYPPFV